MGRLTSFVQSKPKRAAQVIVILVVVLVVFAATALVYALDLSFGLPYPSEETPLSFVSGTVTWTQSVNTTVYSGGITTYLPDAAGFVAGPSNLSYSEFKFIWGHPIDGWAGGTIVNDTLQGMLSTGSPAVVDSYHSETVQWIDGVLVSYSLYLRISDVLGDGVFGVGDVIEFIDERMTAEPTPEDSVGTIGLAFLGVRLLTWEYSYALHDGVFYSWESNELDTSQPWWE